MNDRQARVEIKALYATHPEVVEAVVSAVKAASPLAGPQRILAEIKAALA